MDRESESTWVWGCTKSCLAGCWLYQLTFVRYLPNTNRECETHFILICESEVRVNRRTGNLLRLGMEGGVITLRWHLQSAFTKSSQLSFLVLWIRWSSEFFHLLCEGTDVPQGHRTGNPNLWFLLTTVVFAYYCSLGYMVHVLSLYVYSSGLGNEKTYVLVMWLSGIPFTFFFFFFNPSPFWDLTSSCVKWWWRSDEITVRFENSELLKEYEMWLFPSAVLRDMCLRIAFSEQSCFLGLGKT